jgi:hypothetical protein
LGSKRHQGDAPAQHQLLSTIDTGTWSGPLVRH